MKPPIDQKFKERFFAQYCGQRVACYDDDEGGNVMFNISPYEFSKTSFMYLLLRPLSSITNEESNEVLRILDREDNYQDEESDVDMEGFSEFIEALFSESPGCFIDAFNANDLSHFIDYLRSCGFAAPFMGYSVEELIEAKLIKLVEQKSTQGE